MGSLASSNGRVSALISLGPNGSARREQLLFSSSSSLHSSCDDSGAGQEVYTGRYPQSSFEVSLIQAAMRSQLSSSIAEGTQPVSTLGFTFGPSQGTIQGCVLCSFFAHSVRDFSTLSKNDRYG